MDESQLENKLNQIDSILEELKGELANDSPQIQSEKPTVDPQARLTSSKVKEFEAEAVETQDDPDKGPPLGQVGVFDGEFVVMPNEKRYQVPPNYASKTMLVVGDELELVSHGDQNEFKIVKQVPRVEFTGILTKKNYQWTIVKDDYEFKVIPAAIRYHGGDIGDKVTIFLPDGYEKNTPQWGAVKSIEKTGVGDGGFAGSSGAEDIATKKRMKYVPPRRGEKSVSSINDEKTTPLDKREDKDGTVPVVDNVVEVDIETGSTTGEIPMVESKEEPETQLASITVIDDIPPLR